MKEQNQNVPYGTSASRLKQIIYEKGWNQSRLARELGISAQAVQLWVKGTSRPNGPNLTKLAEVTGKPESWFFQKEDDAVVDMDGPVEHDDTEFMSLTAEEKRLLQVSRRLPLNERKNMLLAFEMRLEELENYYNKYVNLSNKP